MEHLRSLSDEFGLKIAGIEKNIYEIAGCEFNIDCALARCCLKTRASRTEKTKTGYATDVRDLNELGHLQVPLPRADTGIPQYCKVKWFIWTICRIW